MTSSVTRLDTSARTSGRVAPALRHDWTRAEALGLYDLPFMDLLFRAQCVHRASFDPNKVQKSRLLSIKTGGCAEDCGYCSQSAHHKTGLKASKLMEVERVIAEAKKAKAAGRNALLHGRRLAQSKGARHGHRRSDGRRRQGTRHGNVHDARHAVGRRRREAARRRSRLLQSQHRHVGSLLRQDHHDAHLCRASRYAGARARGRNEGLLGRYRRHGRRARRSRRHARHARQSRRASRKRADQHARSPFRARRSKMPSASIRSISCARSRWPAS